MKILKQFLSLLLSVLIAVPAPAAYAAFDPVNDDTDIFLANPNTPTEQPNVLLIVDNTANWSTQYALLSQALREVVAGLDANAFRVGLMQYSQNDNSFGGGPNIDGSQLRFAVRPMTRVAGSTDPKDNLKDELERLVGAWQPGNIQQNGDKADKAIIGLAFLEAYRYYAGKKSISSWARVKTDKDPGNDPWLNFSPPTPARLEALENVKGHKRAMSGGTVDANTLFNSPSLDGCQKNYIIYIGSDLPSDNAQDTATVISELTALGGNTNTIGLSPSQFQSVAGDEMARYMAENDVLADVAGVGNEHTRGKQTVITYSVEIDPGSTPSRLAATELYKSLASAGKGRYFPVDSSGGIDKLKDALNTIFNEIKSVNTVFAAATLPVSVNVRGTNLNQVYIGVFRPDARKLPRWMGNLKMYQLGRVTETNPDGSTFQRVVLAGPSSPTPAPSSRLADCGGVPCYEATDTNSGFINRDATSLWTVDQGSFWNYRSEVGTWFSAGKDLQDGEVVEKGAVHQKLRLAYNYDAAEANSNRALYTCTPLAGSHPACTSGALLSATPFTLTNTQISEAAFQLGSKAVAPLSAFNTRSVASLTDRRDAALSNASAPFTITSLSTPGTTLTLTSLTTSTPKPVTSLTAAQTDTVGIVSIQKVSGKFVVTVDNTTAPHFGVPPNFVNGALVTIAGSNVAAYDGNWTISNKGATTFEINASGNPGPAGASGTATVITNTTTATAFVTDHGFSAGQVTISGANEAAFNGLRTIFNITQHTFQYSLSSVQGAATGAITASGPGTLVTASTAPAAHGLPAGTSPVSIYGANPAAYNGSKTAINTGASTFTYTLSTPTTDNTASPVYAVSGGTTLVTAIAPGHGLAVGTQVNVTINGASVAAYNGTWNVSVVDGSSFTFNTATDNVAPTTAVTQVLPASTNPLIQGSTTTQSIVTVTTKEHGFTAGESIRIDAKSTPPGPDTNHPGNFTVLAVIDADRFTYESGLGAGAPAPIGEFTARSLTNPKAFVKLAAPHTPPLAGGETVSILGANPAAYDGDRVVTLLPAASGYDFSYPLSPSPGVNTSGTVTSALKTTTATARSVDHGFGAPSTTVPNITISGATPAAFNGTFTVTIVDVNTFTYTLPSAQGNATGTVLATGGGSSSATRDALIRWVRGEDNFADENLDGSATGVRASIHGDVLHSRPAVINYNRYGSNNDVYVFYGSNDGVFRGVKGGFATDAAAAGEPPPGNEAWGFIPPEFFGKFNRLRTASPVISSSFKKPYFADGAVTAYVKDVDNNNQIVAGTDTANIYISMRRGGRLLYALDVANPIAPKFLWKIDNATAGFEELGQTWSQPIVVESLAGLPFPVAIFAGGYDPDVEDVPPDQVIAATSTTVTQGPAPGNIILRSMGRAIYVVNAQTGALVWRAVSPNSNNAATPPAGASSLLVTGMDYAIPSDVSVIRNTSGGNISRAYVGDTGGNVWRIDFKGDGTNLATSTVTQLAALSTVSDPAQRRKFFFPPDVARAEGSQYDAVVIGTGDREHPFEGLNPTMSSPAVTNRIYMLKDYGSDAGPASGVPGATIVHTGDPATETLADLTDDCVDNQANCTGTSTPDNTVAGLSSGANRGWYIDLEPSEKIINAPLIVAGVVFIGSNLPPAAPTAGQCTTLGPARLYRMRIADATPLADYNSSGSLTGADRFVVVGEGLLPSSQYAVDEGGLDTVLTGPITTVPPTLTLQARLRKFWYKEID